jgi:branched-chain amino acid transport system substrate-binding protein
MAVLLRIGMLRNIGSREPSMNTLSIARRPLIAGALASLPALMHPRSARAAAPVRIGVLNDESGPYADLSGPGSVLAVRMAVADAKAAGLSVPVEVLVGDHQNKPNVGLGILREWFSSEQVGLAVDFANSAISLGAQPIAQQFDKLAIHVASTSSELSGKGCGRNGFQWAQTTYADTTGLMRSLLKSGKKSYYLITVDYAFGHAAAADAKNAILQGGGTVVGSVLHPLDAGDFASYLTRAQASGADVVVLVNTGAAFIASVKQAGEFGLSKSQTLVAPFVYLTDVHALGLGAASGLTFLQSWYWDHDDASRAWAKRFFAVHKRMPTDLQAGNYSAALHYLKAVQATGSTDTATVMAAMRSTPVDDMYTRNARIETNNKLFLDLLLTRVKAPEQSKYAWDYLEILATVPAAEAFRAPKDSGCSFAT